MKCLRFNFTADFISIKFTDNSWLTKTTILIFIANWRIKIWFLFINVRLNDDILPVIKLFFYDEQFEWYKWMVAWILRFNWCLLFKKCSIFIQIINLVTIFIKRIEPKSIKWVWNEKNNWLVKSETTKIYVANTLSSHLCGNIVGIVPGIKSTRPPNLRIASGGKWSSQT